MNIDAFREMIFDAIEKKAYDKRFSLFIEHYLMKCVSKYNWNIAEAEEKLTEYTNKINSIRFIHVGKARCTVDLENKFIFLDEKITFNKTDEVILEYIHASFKEQDKILNTNTFEDIPNEDFSKLILAIKDSIKIHHLHMTKEKALMEIDTMLEHQDYDYRFVPFVKEYFLRSLKVYNWSRDELITKIKNYKINVKSIEFGKLKKKCIEFRPEENKIIVNPKLSFYSDEIIIKNFFREQGYATNYTKFITNVYENGLLSNNSATSSEHGLNRYAEEVAANYLTGRVPYSNELYTTCRVSENDGSDYNNKSAYLISMISAAFGISEFEFARLKDRGRVNFEEYFQEIFSYINIDEYLERFFTIINKVEDLPDKLFSTKDLTVEYGNMFNLVTDILQSTEDYNEKYLPIKELKNFKLKIYYLKFKIADSLKQAIRNQCLDKKVLFKQMNDIKLYKKYVKPSSFKQSSLRKVARQIYRPTDTWFDNAILKKIIKREFKHPLIGKISKIFDENRAYKLLREADAEAMDTISALIKITENNNAERKKIIIPDRHLFK